MARDLQAQPLFKPNYTVSVSGAAATRAPPLPGTPPSLGSTRDASGYNAQCISPLSMDDKSFSISPTSTMATAALGSSPAAEPAYPLVPPRRSSSLNPERPSPARNGHGYPIYAAPGPGIGALVLPMLPEERRTPPPGALPARDEHEQMVMPAPDEEGRHHLIGQRASLSPPLRIPPAPTAGDPGRYDTFEACMQGRSREWRP